MLNRKIPPPVTKIRHIDVAPIETVHLDNGVPVVIINAGTEDIVKIEIVHPAGKSGEDKKLASRATASLMKEGCGTMNAETFADKFDFYGAGLKTSANMDFLYTSVYTLGKHVPQLVEPLATMYREPWFDENELKTFSGIQVEKLKEELAKNEVLSYRLVTEAIFGSQHAYGYNSIPEDYLALQRQDLVNHFQHRLGTDNMTIFLSGKITDDVLKIVNQTMGSYHKTSTSKSYEACSVQPFHKRIFHDAPGEMQSSVKVGRRLFDRKHPDQSAFFILNTVLGGYFGSRLMNVLREDKGLTYDVSSQMDQMLHDGCFYIGLELGSAHVEEAIQIIYDEMNLLCQTKIPEKELDMVKNYLAGNFLHMVDGPLQLSVVAKTMALIGLPFSELQNWIQHLMDTSAEEVLLCAQKYLRQEDMVEVVVG